MAIVRLLVCVKRVPAPGARINVTDDGLSVETAHLGFTTSPHEECAVEEAVQLAERAGGTVTVLTLGPPEAEEQLRYAASVGADELVLVPTDGTAWDPQRTAVALAEAIGRLEAAGGPFDLILFGNESADAGGFQVGVRVATALGRPIVNGIKGIEIEAGAGETGAGGAQAGGAEAGGSGTGEAGGAGAGEAAGAGAGGAVIARRAVDAGFEVYRLPLPAVVGVKEGINLPRYPTMKGRLASKKADLATMAIDAEPGGQHGVRLHRPEEVVSDTEVLGDSAQGADAAAVAVVDLLEELGVLP